MMFLLPAIIDVARRRRGMPPGAEISRDFRTLVRSPFFSDTAYNSSRSLLLPSAERAFFFFYFRSDNYPDSS